MNLLFWALTLNVIGSAMIAYGVINAHSALAHEHRVDVMVVKSFRFERFITILGVGLIVVAYIMEIYFLGGFSHMLTCQNVTDCTITN